MAPEAEADAHGAEAGDHGEEHGPASVIMHHVTDQTFFGFRSKHLVFFVLAALLVVLGARLAVRSYRGGRIPRGLAGAVEALVVFIRDEVAEPNIGHGDGRKFTPLLCSFFFFILVAALLGLVPLPAYERQGPAGHLHRQHRGDDGPGRGLLRRPAVRGDLEVRRRRPLQEPGPAGSARSGCCRS